MSNFVISLDFELKWGMLDSGQGYNKNILGARKAIPLILETFKEFNIVSTWAIVGMLFNSNYDEFKKYRPSLTIKTESTINPYNIELNSPDMQNLFFAPELVKLIINSNTHEVATHTYSHFDLSSTNDLSAEFKEDIKMAIKIAREKYNIDLKTIIFPRNKINRKYFSILKELGITHYRGNPNNVLYRFGHNKNNILLRTLRYIDSFIKITKNNKRKDERSEVLIDVMASRMLRPYIKNKFLNYLMLKRIKNEMLMAAKEDYDYHLWWHPHNFGVNTKDNIKNLANILSYYNHLRKKYGMKSTKMSEI
tara:strand:+ start:209 stop:1132 length:924 start_codon:yes stop_codon:yes gene_type:complete